jgi:hypothetical protein
MRFYRWFEMNAIGYLSNAILFVWLIFALKH